MYLSRVELPWEFARNPYNLHRAVWKLFPDEDREVRKSQSAERQGFLFRVESAPVGRAARLLVQSRRVPRAAAGVNLLGSREFHPQPAEGLRLAFVLTANPVKTVVDAEAKAKPGKLARMAEKAMRRGDKLPRSPKSRVPLVKEDEQRVWLSRKLDGAGIVQALNVLPNAATYFRKGDRNGKLVTASFEGVMQVIDPKQLLHLLENGIGPAKAFGCGLLLVRRVG